MLEETVRAEVPLGEEIVAAGTLCRHALKADYPDLIHRIPAAPKSPEACFELLGGIPYDRRRIAALRQLKAEAERAGLRVPHAVERFIVLQSYLIALPRLPSLPVDDCVNRQFIATCRQVASPLLTRENRLAQDSDAFAELAQIVTLRRFHAGELSFDIMKMPRAWLLKAHPIELPGLIRKIVCSMDGFGPVVIPHVNYWRRNPMITSRAEHKCALLRIGKSIERDRRIKGLVSSSWLYCDTVGKHFPHMGWLRDFFVDHNAYIVDLGPALVDSGFLIGSEKRRRLYANGAFHPRETLIVWPRAEIMAWMSSDLSQDNAARPRNVPPLNVVNVGAPQRPTGEQKPIPDRILRSGKLTLIDCKRLLFYKPRRYIAIVLLLPAFCAAILATAMWTVETGYLAFLFAVPFMWLFQYFVLQ
jgi:hypothetical protein